MKKQERSALSEVEGEKMHKERHSLAHILAMAVLKKFPEAKLGIGPVIDNGFYYDFLLPEALSDKDLPKIRKDMQKIIQQKVEFKKNIVSREEALKKAKANNDPFKEELINDLPANEEISFYSSGDFADLCRGPHVNDSSEINPKAFALTSTAGAYWRGDEKNQMLTRVYGVAFETKEELDEYLELLAEAKKRDHRKLGKEMDLFVFSELIGPGLPVYTPKGASIRKGIVDFSNALQKTIGYDEVHSPQINKAELFKISYCLPQRYTLDNLHQRCLQRSLHRVRFLGIEKIYCRPPCKSRPRHPKCPGHAFQQSHRGRNGAQYEG